MNDGKRRFVPWRRGQRTGDFDTGRKVRLTYNKKTTGQTVTRVVIPMRQDGDILFAQHGPRGQIKKFIVPRISNAEVDGRGKPQGGFVQEL